MRRPIRPLHRFTPARGLSPGDLSNLESALRPRTLVAGETLFRTSGRTVTFPGFFRAYVEGSDDPEAALEHQEAPLPPLAVGEAVQPLQLRPMEHETKPPARYTEATLVKALEAEGIGRPSTYATIIHTIFERGYGFRQRKELVPSFTAFAVTALLEQHFPELVDLHFTAEMEQKLDDIASGGAGWLDFLRKFYLGQGGLASQIEEKEASLDPRNIVALSLDEPRAEVRIGQFGPFLTWEEGGQRMTTSLPPEIPPADLCAATVARLIAQKREGPSVLSAHPETGEPIYVKEGPYGPYVQLGENGESGKKPKRVSLLKGMRSDEVSADLALQLLALPRTLGKHTETNKVVKAGVGRFGPYVLYDRRYVSIKEPMRVLEMDLQEALELMASAPAKRGGEGKKALKDLGAHPEDGKPIRVMDGRYGPYVNHGRLNATLPKDMPAGDVTLALALELLAARAQKKKAKRK